MLKYKKVMETAKLVMENDGFFYIKSTPVMPPEKVSPYLEHPIGARKGHGELIDYPLTP